MHDGELWQVFQQNGQPVEGRGLIDDAFDKDETLVQGNAHVWFWRKTAAGIDVLLQKRALTKKKSPGFYHVSAAGHINVGESALEAAVRETHEEVGVAIDPGLLYLVNVTRATKNLQSLLHVYIYELNGDEEFTFEDGEVDSVKWVNVDVFTKMTANAAEHKLVGQEAVYFDPLIAAIRRNAA
jgi:8-oxo-dGTP pyrophosphatase MutT (NUDIX family)